VNRIQKRPSFKKIKKHFLNFTAVMLLAKNDYQRAFDACKTALNLNPNSNEAKVNFGDMLRQVYIKYKIKRKDNKLNSSGRKRLRYTNIQNIFYFLIGWKQG
jgi:lipoprotein NlpI